MIWNIFNKKDKELEKNQESSSTINKSDNPVSITTTEKITKPAKAQRAAKPKKVKIEPKVDIIKFDFDPNNPRLGSIELDWNSEFVALLSKHGYLGKDEEEIVDKWLNDVCRTIISNPYQGTNVPADNFSNVSNKKNLGNGKSEIS
jgi:hypothetical protein